MIFGLFGRKKSNRQIVDTLYGSLTQAARNPAFYDAMSVPDTVMGRFEMVSAHMILLMRRTFRGNAGLKSLSQDLVDTFFEDLDHSIREIGIGDTGVPKRMKKFAQMVYGRFESYSAALDGDDHDALATALARNIFPNADSEERERAHGDMGKLADHLFAVEAAWRLVPEKDLLSGRLPVPEPANLAHEGERGTA